MATVYTHIDPLPKRAINFFKQCFYKIGKRGQINSTLDGLLRKEEFFNEFLASFGPALKPWEREYIRDRAAEVAVSLNNAYAEQTILQGILAALNPCPACDGVGELRHIIEQDHSEYSKCPACDGEGVLKAKV